MVHILVFGKKAFREVTSSVIKALKRACCEIAVALYRSNTIDRNHVLLFIHRTPSSKEIRMSPADWRNVIYKAYRECRVSISNSSAEKLILKGLFERILPLLCPREIRYRPVLLHATLK